MSRICSYCGKELSNESSGFCPYCGGKLESDQSTVQQGYDQGYGQSYSQPYSQPYNQPYAQPYVQSFVPMNQTTSVGGWIGWLLLCSILPIIGQIIMLCSAKDESTKNYAKANFVLLGIYIVILILIFVLLGIGGASLSDYM